jgi:hypothetical protein
LRTRISMRFLVFCGSFKGSFKWTTPFLLILNNCTK